MRRGGGGGGLRVGIFFLEGGVGVGWAEYGEGERIRVGRERKREPYAVLWVKGSEIKMVKDRFA